MTLSLVAVIVLLIGLLLHYIGSGPVAGKPGGSTVAELGRAMIWVGMFFVVAGAVNHSALTLTR